MLEQVEEERAWEWYLASLSRPGTEVISFNEFKEQNFKGAAKEEKRRRTKAIVTPKEKARAQIAESQRILRLMPPPDKMRKEGR